MNCTVTLTRQAAKQMDRLPEQVKSALLFLLHEISRCGPVRGDWPNYGKLGPKRHHCHIRKGKPTYVVVWQEVAERSGWWRLPMLERTRRRHTEHDLEARFIGSREKIDKLRDYAREIGLFETTETVTLAEAFPGYAENPQGMALRGARHREGLTQRQLADLTGIQQRHLSELENGKRQMGREWAKKIAHALNVSDYRMLL